VTIGTTHFINAVIERDEYRLRRVAILRVSKSFLREVPPFSEWPSGLGNILHSYVGYVDGGLQIDGAEEAPINEQQVIEEAHKIKSLGLTAIVVAGVFSPIDDTHRQEDRICDILLREIPHADVVRSHTVANLGFMERENASVLNAAILQYARKTIRNFKTAMKDLGLTCPLLITQNDGTVLDASTAASVPIRTFLSGPTNSMRGAAYLSGLQFGKSKDEEEKTEAKVDAAVRSHNKAPQCIVIDIGGTTSDLGIIMPSGMPMQAAAYVKVAGVEVNYSMPHLYSIGLGGGSIVREEDGKVIVGPQSVGRELVKKAFVFGGDTVTATDIVVAAGRAHIGDPSKVSHLSQSLVQAALDEMKRMLERAIDVIKLSPEPLPVLLVGGGAILAPDSLEGTSQLIRPQFHDVANAVGAAISRVCGLVDIIQSTVEQTVPQAVEYAVKLATSRAIAAGALSDTIQIAEIETIPVSYVENRVRTVVRAVGDLDSTKALKDESELVEDSPLSDKATVQVPLESSTFVDAPTVDPSTYRPRVVLNGSGIAEWEVSETDLHFLADGCYVLGCAGGGSPRSTKIQLINMLRKGYISRIVDPSSLGEEDVLIGGGGLGSPAVGIERLAGIDAIGAIKILLKYLQIDKWHAVMPLEVGGSNGLQPLLMGSSRFFDVPVVDADWMGRAYPTAWQTTLSAHSPGQLVPCAIDGGDGNSIIMTSSATDKMVDSILRAACVEMGSAVGAATKPNTTEQVRKYSVLNTLSLAWRIGRCIAQSTATNNLSTVAEAIVDEAGGPTSAKVLFRGKIVEVENRLSKGHSYGVVHIKAFDAEDGVDQSSNHRSTHVAQGGVLKVPFKNENIYAEHTVEDGSINIIASVPDLIAILDNGSGKALGVPEFKYGYQVTVIGITCSPRWVDTPEALQVGGPAAFGFDHSYVPVGKYVPPRSVIEEFGPQ
jgi:DUF917 family protein/N-methylhydantoinase A/oxoprolinase/acetone carboxylase beta subunit